MLCSRGGSSDFVGEDGDLCGGIAWEGVDCCGDVTGRGGESEGGECEG